MCSKGICLYDRWMSHALGKALADGPAVPVTLTCSRDQGHWVLRVWYHGNTTLEALHPLMLAERYIDPEQVPAHASWRTLYTHVAIAVEDLAQGEGALVRGE